MQLLRPIKVLNKVKILKTFPLVSTNRGVNTSQHVFYCSTFVPRLGKSTLLVLDVQKDIVAVIKLQSLILTVPIT